MIPSLLFFYSFIPWLIFMNEIQNADSVDTNGESTQLGSKQHKKVILLSLSNPV